MKNTDTDGRTFQDEFFFPLDIEVALSHQEFEALNAELQKSNRTRFGASKEIANNVDRLRIPIFQAFLQLSLQHPP